MFSTFRGMITTLIVLMVLLMVMSLLLVFSTYRASSALSEEVNRLSQQKESISNIYLDFLEIKAKGTKLLLTNNDPFDFGIDEKKEAITTNLDLARKILPEDSVRINKITSSLESFFNCYQTITEKKKLLIATRDSLETAIKTLSRLSQLSNSSALEYAYHRLFEAHNLYLSNPNADNYSAWQFARNNFQRNALGHQPIIGVLTTYNHLLLQEDRNNKTLNTAFTKFNEITTELDSTLANLTTGIRTEYTNKSRTNALVRRNEQRNQMLFILLAFLLSNSALFYIMWNISQPLSRLLQLVKAVENGDYEQRFEFNSQNELASLGYAFNSMLNTIERDRETIQKHQQELENKVRIRTEELEKAKQQAEQASQAKSDFLAKMSHEIRTPMNGIIGTAEVLFNSGLNQQQKELLKIIQNSGSAMLNIINDILDYSKIESGKMEIHIRPFSFRKIIDLTLSQFKLDITKKNLILRQEIETDLPDLYLGDPDKIKQVLVNLLSNAIKFTHAGEIALLVNKEKIEANTIYLHIKVADTGIGIPADRLETVFESFTQVDNSASRAYGGTGLGTTISKNLLELMNGKIWAQSPNPESTENKGGPGSIFHVILPLPVTDKYIINLVNGTSVSLHDILIVVLTHTPELMKALEELKQFNHIQPIVCQTLVELGKIAEKAINEDKDIILLTDYYIFRQENLDGIKQLISNANLSIIALIPDVVASDDSILQSFGIKHILTLPFHQSVFLDKIEEILNDRYDNRTNRQITSLRKQIKDKPIRLLLAEDNPINQKVACKIFETIGFEIEIANNGQEAVQKGVNESFDLIFMDIQMPVVNGYDATRQLRLKGVKTPIIAMTANAMNGDKDICLSYGMNDYIAKPITYNAITDMIKKWVFSNPEPVQSPEKKQEIKIKNEVIMQYPILDEAEAINRVYDKDLLKELLLDFSNMKELDWSIFDQHFAANNITEIEHLSHAIKGVAGNLALIGIYKTATALNDAAKQNRTADLLQLYQNLKTEVERFRQFLPSYLNN